MSPYKLIVSDVSRGNQDLLVVQTIGKIESELRHKKNQKICKYFKVFRFFWKSLQDWWNGGETFINIFKQEHHDCFTGKTYLINH